MATPLPTEEEVLGWMISLSNWDRWGPDDELGTLNLITPEKRAQAGRLVQEGISVTCSRLIVPEIASDVTSIPPLHYMINTGKAAPSRGPGSASDFIGLSFHGLTITHLDSLCHQFWDGKMYNGKPASLVTAQQKAAAGDIDKAQHGTVTRGVLLDITQVRGREWLEAGEGVFPEDLEAAEATQGVRVEEGDALLLRLGWCKRRQQVGAPDPPGRPGLHAAALRGYISGASPSLWPMPRTTSSPAVTPRLGCPSIKSGSSRWDCGSSTTPIAKTWWTCAGG